MALGAASCYQAVIFLIPMAEGFGSAVSMAGASPVSLKWNCTAQGGPRSQFPPDIPDNPDNPQLQEILLPSSRPGPKLLLPSLI